MHLGAAFVADEQPFELVQVREGALDNPTESAEAGAMLGAAASDHRRDPAGANEPAVLVVVVATVTDYLVGAPSRPPDKTADRGHAVEQRDQLRDVVAVAARECEGERDPGRIDEEMVLRSGSAPVNRARARFGAPFSACTWLPSTIARDHSICPAARNRVNSSACRLSHTPARCHSSSLRQQVYPDPYPSSCGRCIHGIPVCNTNKMPDSASRSGSRLRPGYLARRGFFGNSGSTSSHNSSGMTQGEFAAIRTPPSLTTDADVLRHLGTGPFILQ